MLPRLYYFSQTESSYSHQLPYIRFLHAIWELIFFSISMYKNWFPVHFHKTNAFSPFTILRLRKHKILQAFTWSFTFIHMHNSQRLTRHQQAQSFTPCLVIDSPLSQRYNLFRSLRSGMVVACVIVTASAELPHKFHSSKHNTKSSYYTEVHDIGECRSNLYKGCHRSWPRVLSWSWFSPSPPFALRYILRFHISPLCFFICYLCTCNLLLFLFAFIATIATCHSLICRFAPCAPLFAACTYICLPMFLCSRVFYLTSVNAHAIWTIYNNMQIYILTRAQSHIYIFMYKGGLINLNFKAALLFPTRSSLLSIVKQVFAQ